MIKAYFLPKTTDPSQSTYMYTYVTYY